MPKRMKRPRMSGKKASRKMDVAYDNLLDLISLQLNEGDYAGAQRTCERLLASESLPRRKRGAACRYLGHALALGGDFAAAYAAYSDSLLYVPERADVWINRSQVSSQLGNMESAAEDLVEARRLADDTDLADLVQAWLQRYDGESAEEKSAQLDLLLL